MRVSYDNREEWILAILERHGPVMRRSKLLQYCRHFGNAAEVDKTLKRLQRRKQAEVYTESWQAQRRIEHRKMVRLLVDSELEAMLG